ncbi:uncharacterized protein LOC128393713 [Panonychus citri]|uniref:uncharacterized protein LOC128393713 n=1 Tax=Panonychus citri TaxID=50023 RepID=UPI002307069D|nr:uncharacterized protein LOC128393713 [Panonychus citri]
MSNWLILVFVNLLVSFQFTFGQYDYYGSNGRPTCNIPSQLQGEWYSREKGLDITTTVSETEIIKGSSSDYGSCVNMVQHGNDNYTFHLRSTKTNCHYCVRILIRTLNVLEKIDGGCVSLSQGVRASLGEVCRSADLNAELITMFSTNPQGRNCKSSLEGVWSFGYRLSHVSASECYDSESQIKACQKPGNQFSIVNQQFTMIYKSCGSNGENKEIQYKCLGDWYVGKNHYFAVVNSRDSRRSESYRCFLTNRDDPTHIAVSTTAECNTLTSPQQGPERLTLHPSKAETVVPACQLPDAMRGEWINTANLDALVKINSTHMEERWRPDTGTEKEEIYVCQQRKGSRYVMARLGINGCQKDFVCFDFVAPHHNIIRYRKGQAMSSDQFGTICAWTNFDANEEWKYEILLAAKPVAIKCPVAGKFKFNQKGEIPFATRIRGGVTQSPRNNVKCKQIISDLSICDPDQKIMEIDAEYCISVDHRGTSIDYQSDPDHRMKCIGFWKEDLKSYLITYDEMDAYSRYRCWVYQRSDLNRVLMSMSVGAFCHSKQRVSSWNSSEGAQVALDMVEYEREHDECPMYFDDGSNPYSTDKDSAIILDARTSGSTKLRSNLIVTIIIVPILIKAAIF